jgi:hypothetical protein
MYMKRLELSEPSQRLKMLERLSTIVATKPTKFSNLLVLHHLLNNGSGESNAVLSVVDIQASSWTGSSDLSNPAVDKIFHSICYNLPSQSEARIVWSKIRIMEMLLRKKV